MLYDLNDINIEEARGAPPFKGCFSNVIVLTPHLYSCHHTSSDQLCSMSSVQRCFTLMVVRGQQKTTNVQFELAP